MAPYLEKALTAVRVNALKQKGRYADGNSLYLVVDDSGVVMHTTSFTGYDLMFWPSESRCSCPECLAWPSCDSRIGRPLDYRSKNRRA